MIQHWDIVGNWYEIAQTVCLLAIAVAIIVVIYDCIKKRKNAK